MIDHRVYLGPYLECEYGLVPIEQHRKVCRTEGCFGYGKSPQIPNLFCGYCGQAFTDVSEFINKPSVDKWQLIDDIDEAMFFVPLEYIKLDKPVHIWIPNVHRDAPREFLTDPTTDYQVTKAAKSMMYDEAVWLLDAFAEEIAVLQKHYKSCQVTWGLIVYAN